MIFVTEIYRNDLPAFFFPKKKIIPCFVRGFSWMNFGMGIITIGGYI